MASTEEHQGLALPHFDAPPSILIIAAPFYRDIADHLIAGARAALDLSARSMNWLRFPARWKSRRQSGLRSAALKVLSPLAA